MATTQAPERHTVAGPAGALEVLVEHPALEAPSTATGLCIIAHPHPLHGGTMNNKVAYTLARTATLCGRIAVRFNFRGVDASEGSHDDGRGEVDDVIAIAAWARQHYARQANDAAWVAGFSFGACMAAAAAGRVGATQAILVAPAVERYSTADTTLEIPLLLAQGMADEVVSAQAALAWAARQPGSVEVLEFDGVGHFFHGAQVELRTRLVAALTGDSA
ncbi:MAG: CocE/NonD family hydrolase [Pseudomonadota bacterium]